MKDHPHWIIGLRVTIKIDWTKHLTRNLMSPLTHKTTDLWIFLLIKCSTFTSSNNVKLQTHLLSNMNIDSFSRCH